MCAQKRRESAIAPKPLTAENLEREPHVKGLYTIFCKGLPVPLYIGIAGKDKKKEVPDNKKDQRGLDSRLLQHLTSYPGDSFPKALADDKELSARYAVDLADKEQRRRFLEQCCTYVALVLRGLDDDNLERLEAWAIDVAHPRLNTIHNWSSNQLLPDQAPPCACGIAPAPVSLPNADVEPARNGSLLPATLGGALLGTAAIAAALFVLIRGKEV